jgi:hypothetical protein
MKHLSHHGTWFSIFLTYFQRGYLGSLISFTSGTLSLSLDTLTLLGSELCNREGELPLPFAIPKPEQYGMQIKN